MFSRDFTWVTHSDSLTSQMVDDCWQVHALRKDHGYISLQHLAQCLGSGEQNLSCTVVVVVLIQFTEDMKEEKTNKNTYFHTFSQSEPWSQLISYLWIQAHSKASIHANLKILRALSTFPTFRARRPKSDQSSCSVRWSCLPRRRSPASVEMVFILPSGSFATTGVLCAFPLDEWMARVFS